MPNSNQCFINVPPGKRRLPLNQQYAIECEECSCLFVPGGRDSTKICSGCYRNKFVLVKNALNYLVEMKDYKDINGKDKVYFAGRDIAWADARKALNKCATSPGQDVDTGL